MEGPAGVGRDLGVIAPDLDRVRREAGLGGLRPFDLAEEIAPMLDVVRAAGAPVHLVGHSYGGAAALHIARREQPRGHREPGAL